MRQPPLIKKFDKDRKALMFFFLKSVGYKSGSQKIFLLLAFKILSNLLRFKVNLSDLKLDFKKIGFLFNDQQF